VLTEKVVSYYRDRTSAVIQQQQQQQQHHHQQQIQKREKPRQKQGKQRSIRLKINLI
jgi:hypothetical protein